MLFNWPAILLSVDCLRLLDSGVSSLTSSSSEALSESSVSSSRLALSAAPRAGTLNIKISHCDLLREYVQDDCHQYKKYILITSNYDLFKQTIFMTEFNWICMSKIKKYPF